MAQLVNLRDGKVMVYLYNLGRPTLTFHSLSFHSILSAYTAAPPLVPVAPCHRKQISALTSLSQPARRGRGVGIGLCQAGTHQLALHSRPEPD